LPAAIDQLQVLVYHLVCLGGLICLSHNIMVI
jgi:hypothetical protein